MSAPGKGGIYSLKYELKNKIDPISFLKTVDQCTGDVFLESREGTRLDLKSQICKLLFLTLKEEDPVIQGSKVECSGKDSERLSEYLVISE